MNAFPGQIFIPAYNFVSDSFSKCINYIIFCARLRVFIKFYPRNIDKKTL